MSGTVLAKRVLEELSPNIGLVLTKDNSGVVVRRGLVAEGEAVSRGKVLCLLCSEAVASGGDGQRPYRDLYYRAEPLP